MLHRGIEWNSGGAVVQFVDIQNPKKDSGRVKRAESGSERHFLGLGPAAGVPSRTTPAR